MDSTHTPAYIHKPIISPLLPPFFIGEGLIPLYSYGLPLLNHMDLSLFSRTLTIRFVAYMDLDTNPLFSHTDILFFFLVILALSFIYIIASDSLVTPPTFFFQDLIK